MAILGDFFTISSGGTPNKKETLYYKNGTIPWVKTGDLKDKYVPKEIECITEEGLNNSSAKLFPKDTVLVAMYGATIGACSILSYEASTNQACAAFLPNKNILSEYLFYFLSSKKEKFIKDGVGGAQPNISVGYLKNVEFEITSLEEQQKIINTLNKADKLITFRKRQLEKLDQFVKARFVEMFFDKDFPVFKWNDVFYTTTGKLDSNAMVPDGEYPFFTCAKEMFRIDKYAFDQEALLLAGNNAAGKYDVKHYKGKFNAYQRTYVLTLKQDWSYQLFRYQLEDKLTYLQEQSKGSNTRYITLKILGDLEFIVPPVELQNEFAIFVEQVDKSKFAVQQSLDKLETLKKSLMQKYFG